MNAETMMAQIKPQAEQKIKTQLVLEAVAKAEGLEVSDADVEAELKKVADSYGMELDKVKETFAGEREDLFKKDLVMQKALEFIADNAKEKAAKAKKAAKAEKAEGEETAEAKPKKAKAEKAEGEAKPKKAKAEAAADGEEKPKKTRAKKTEEKTEE